MVGGTRVPLSQGDPGLATAENRDWLSICVYSDSEARWGVPLVSMVNSTSARQSDNLGRGCRPGLDFARFRGVLVQRQVAAIAVVVCDVFGQEPAQMGFVENDHMGEQACTYG